MCNILCLVKIKFKHKYEIGLYFGRSCKSILPCTREKRMQRVGLYIFMYMYHLQKSAIWKFHKGILSLIKAIVA